MTIEQVIQYVIHTPYNTNRAILDQMLKNMIVYYGGNPNTPGEGPDGPDIPGKDVVYDGGLES